MRVRAAQPLTPDVTRLEQQTGTPGTAGAPRAGGARPGLPEAAVYTCSHLDASVLAALPAGTGSTGKSSATMHASVQTATKLAGRA
jgi:hypothetical protein